MKSAITPANPQEDLRAQGAACIQAFREQFDFVHRCVRRYGAGAAEIEDLVQEVFIAMWRRWSDFDRSRPLRPWLAGISFRVVRCHIRRRRPDTVLSGTTAGPGPSGDIAAIADLAGRDAQEAASDARALVLAAIDRLPERHRLPLVMHELDELTPDEIARLLAVPVSTVYTRVRRARLAFAKAVEELRGPSRRERVGANAALLPPGLLALEREPPVAPATARAQAEAFAEAIIKLPEPPPDPLRDEPVLSVSRPLGGLTAGARLALLGAAGIAAIVALAVVTARALRARPELPVSVLKVDEAPPVSKTAPRPVLRSVPALQVAPAALPASYSPEVAKELGKGLTGYWPLDDGPGARVAHDRSGRGRHCHFRELSSPNAWITGVKGRALFLGATTWLHCPQPPVLREEPIEMTIAVWVKRRSPRDPSAVVTRQIGRGFEDQFFLGFKADSLRLQSHAWGGIVSAPAPPPSERWHHTAFTHERDGATRLYLDGVEVAYDQGGPVGAGLIDSSITIGAGRYSKNIYSVRQRLDGAVDEIVAYDRALSPLEIRALAAGVVPLIERRNISSK